MNDDTGAGRDPQGRSRFRRAAVLTAAAAGIALPLAACGGGGPSAAAGSTTYQKAVAYAQCMRSHGQAGFPDPNSQGNFLIGPSNHLQQGSPQFASANKACQHLLPGGGQLTAAQQQKALSQALKFVACMRAHGLPSFPDPILKAGGVEMHGPAGLGPNSPQLKSAQQACQKLMPGGGL